MYEIEEQPEEGAASGETDQQESPLEESLRVQRSSHKPDARKPNERVMNVLQVSCHLIAIVSACLVAIFAARYSLHLAAKNTS